MIEGKALISLITAVFGSMNVWFFSPEGNERKVINICILRVKENSGVYCSLFRCDAPEALAPEIW